MDWNKVLLVPAKRQHDLPARKKQRPDLSRCFAD